MPIASMPGATGGYTPVLSSDGQSVWFSQDGEFIDVLVDPSAWVRAACDTAGRSLSQGEWAELVPGDEPYRDPCAEARGD